MTLLCQLMFTLRQTSPDGIRAYTTIDSCFITVGASPGEQHTVDIIVCHGTQIMHVALAAEFVIQGGYADIG